MSLFITVTTFQLIIDIVRQQAKQLRKGSAGVKCCENPIFTYIQDRSDLSGDFHRQFLWEGIPILASSAFISIRWKCQHIQLSMPKPH